MKKCILALLLFFVLVLGTKGRIAYAALQGAGTETSPFMISTVEDLNEIDGKTGYFKLANDIDLKNVERAPLSIGEGSTFDGNQHTLKNLKVVGSGDAGLFGALTGVAIQNLTMENVNVVTSNTDTSLNVGGLVGTATNCSLNNIWIKGNTIIGGDSSGSGGGGVGFAKDNTTIKNMVVMGTSEITAKYHSGGVVGSLYYSTIEDSIMLALLKLSGEGMNGGLTGVGRSATILRCQVNSDIEVIKGQTVGGLVGMLDNIALNRVSLSQTHGTLENKSDSTSCIGGFVGFFGGEIYKSSSDMKILPGSASDVGSFAGVIYTIATISNAYALGSIETTKPVGFTGKLSETTGKITNVYSATGVTGSTKVDLVGAYTGAATISQIKFSYFDRNLIPVTTTSTFAKTTEQMKTQSNYTGWDFNTIWKIEPGEYPTLIEMPPLAKPEDYENNNEEMIAKLSILLQKNETVQLIMTESLQDNTNYTWVSNNPQVVTVDANGKVVAVGDGVTTITVTNKTTEKVETISVHVSGTAISSEERLSVYLMVGSKVKLTVSKPNQEVTYTSMDPSIATVTNDGVVTAVSKGMAIIKAEYNGTTELLYVKVNQ